MRDFEIVQAAHEPGRDAFHRVRDLRRKKTDAVERVPTISRFRCALHSAWELPMNLNLVEARSPLRATFASGERTRRRHQRFMGPMRFKMKRRLSRTLRSVTPVA